MRSLAAIFCAAALLTLCGCSSGRVNDKYYLRAMQVYTDDDTSLDMEFFAEDISVRRASGDGLSVAKKQAELMCGKEISTGYTELLIIGGSGCCDVLTDMLNDWRVSPSCLVICCTDGSLLTESSAEQLTGAVREAVRQGIVPECGLKTVLGDLLHGSAEVPELLPDGTLTTVKIYP